MDDNIITAAESAENAAAQTGGEVQEILHLENVCKKLGRYERLSGASLTVNRGDIYCLLGEPAAGKSIIVCIASGVIKADSGTVRLFGEDIASFNDHQKIGVLFEQMPFTQMLSIKENLRRQAILCGAGKEDINRVVELTGIGGILKMLCININEIERKLVGIACAMLTKPELLILDEPGKGEDAQVVADAVAKIIAQGDTTIFISCGTIAKIGPVATLANRFGVLEEGKVAYEITSEEITSKHLLRLTVDDAAGAKHFLAQYASAEDIIVNGYTVTMPDPGVSHEEIKQLLEENYITVESIESTFRTVEEYFYERSGVTV